MNFFVQDFCCKCAIKAFYDSRQFKMIRDLFSSEGFQIMAKLRLKMVFQITIAGFTTNLQPQNKENLLCYLFQTEDSLKSAKKHHFRTCDLTFHSTTWSRYSFVLVS